MKRVLFYSLALALLSGGALEAQVPQTMSYQGVLLDASGAAVPDGSYDITFRLYDDPVGGTLLWSETATVEVSKGTFSAVLGMINPLSVAFDRPYWLAIAVEGGAELIPLARLTASPYSLNARSVADGAVTSESIAGGQVVKSINALKDDVTLAAGSNVTITPSGNTLTIAATAGGAGDITAVNAGTGLSGGGTSGDVTLSVAVPLSSAGSSSMSIISGTNSGTGSGVQGNNSNGNFGFLGSSSHGVYGEANGTGRAVEGMHGSNNFGELGTESYGAYGQNSAGNYGYFGSANNGAFGRHASGNTGELGSALAGVRGYSANGNGVSGETEDGHGVYGYHATTGNYGYLGAYPYAVMGESVEQYGVRGISSSSYGMYATSATSTAVRAIRTGGGDYAGRFSGNVEVTGTLSKGGGSFKIDHPLDPENKYLYHSFVESPDMMNVYNGNVALGGNGEAWVDLPAWFEALNRDYRYQLTAVGSPAPNLHVAERIANNRFKIAGGSAGMEISWQVTGIRRDPFAEAHRIAVEVDKPAGERGKYLYAKEYGRPESMGVEYDEMQKMEEDLRTLRERHRLDREKSKADAEVRSR